jgi:Flp pilus assembly protein TadB
MPSRASLRAADADRERVAERLRRASVEGRLLTEELEQRLEAALRARTYGELDALTADLPSARVLARRAPRALGAGVPALVLALAVALALVLAAVVVLVVTGVIAGWCLWLALAWWFFGPRRFGRHGRALSGGCCGVRAARVRTHSSRPV